MLTSGRRLSGVLLFTAIGGAAGAVLSTAAVGGGTAGLIAAILGALGGAAAGVLVSRPLLLRFPRLTFSVLRLLIGVLIGGLPGFAVALLSGHQPRLEVFGLSLTDMLAMLLLVVGVPAGAFFGLVSGCRLVGSAADDWQDPSGSN